MRLLLVSQSRRFFSLVEFDLEEEAEKVKKWYDGFIFGNHSSIYNSWSILHFLDTGKYDTYWANTSSNTLISKLIREGSSQEASVRTGAEAFLSWVCTWAYCRASEPLYNYIIIQKNTTLLFWNLRYIIPGRKKDRGDCVGGSETD